MCIRDSNKPYRGWKISFFEGGIRVPFIFSWPNEISSDVKIDSAIHHFDIFSTIASAAGINTDNLNLDGVNLLPYIKKENLEQISNEDELLKIVMKTIEENPKQHNQYKSGKDKLFGFFVGQVMKETQGSADPKVVNEILRKELNQ